jgi:hypothetical protein
MMRILILFITIILSTACGPHHLSLGEDAGNGAGYPGGDGIDILGLDHFYNFRPESECRSASDTFCYKWKIDLTVRTRPVLFSKFDAEYRGYPKASHLYKSPHNPDFIGDGGAILTKPKALPLDGQGKPTLIPEAWCMGAGRDVVILSTHDGAKKMGRTYSESQSEDSPATRSIDGTVYTYEFGSNRVAIDRSKTTLQSAYRYFGTLTTDGGQSQIDVECSLGSTSQF